MQQIVFPSPAEAEAAFARIREGAAFEAIAAERGVSPQDLELGTFAKTEMLDPAVADAAFALQEGAVSGPVQGRFGTVLVRVAEVQPEAVRAFEEVAGEVKRQIAQERARGRARHASTTRSRTMRACARPLAEIAREKSLALVQVPAVDQAGRDKAGQPVAEPARRREALAARPPSRPMSASTTRRCAPRRRLCLVRRDRDRARPRQAPSTKCARRSSANGARTRSPQRLAEKARALVERLDKGEAIEAVAGEVGAPAKTATDLARRTAKDDLTAEAVTRIFTTPVGQAGSAADGGDTPGGVQGDLPRPCRRSLTTTQEAQRTEDQLRDALGDDLIAEYIAQAQGRSRRDGQPAGAAAGALGGGG